MSSELSVSCLVILVKCWCMFPTKKCTHVVPTWVPMLRFSYCCLSLTDDGIVKKSKKRDCEKWLWTGETATLVMDILMEVMVISYRWWCGRTRRETLRSLCKWQLWVVGHCYVNSFTDSTYKLNVMMKQWLENTMVGENENWICSARRCREVFFVNSVAFLLRLYLN